MALAKKRGNEEVYQCYDIKGQETRFVAISEKQMLLLALYFRRETMYDGAKRTFGTMLYVQDVRVLMQKERAAALDLSLHVGRDKLDDVVVKKQNFLCPEDKLIANTQENDVQRQLRACLKDLKLDVGWSVANGQKLVSRADADVFLSGFYVSFTVQHRSCGCQLASADQSTFVDLTCDRSTDIRSYESEFPTFYANVTHTM